MVQVAEIVRHGMMTLLNRSFFRVIPLTKGQYYGLRCFCDVGPHKLLNVKQTVYMTGDLSVDDVHVT